MDSVSTNSGAFAKPKTFDAMTTSMAEIQMHLGLHLNTPATKYSADLHGKEWAGD